MKVVLKNVRLSYEHLFEKHAFNGEGEATYQGTFLFEKNGDTHKQVAKVIKSLIDEKFKGKALPADKICLRDGDEKDAEGYEGMMFIGAKSKRRVPTVGRDKAPVDADDGVFYSGCYVNAVIDLWAQDNKFGKRINASLMGVQFVKDGESLGGATVAGMDDFEDYSDEPEDAPSWAA
jgi:hypothetical protein